jgi:hypothetical protein
VLSAPRRGRGANRQSLNPVVRETSRPAAPHCQLIGSLPGRDGPLTVTLLTPTAGRSVFGAFIYSATITHLGPEGPAA